MSPSAHDREDAEPSNAVLSQTTDLDTLLTAILGRAAEERDDRAQIVAEVDARVAGVIDELGLRQLLDARREQQIAETFSTTADAGPEPPPPASERSVRISAVGDLGRRLLRFLPSTVVPFLPVVIGAGLIALVAVVWLSASGRPHDATPDVVVAPASIAAPAPTPELDLPPEPPSVADEGAPTSIGNRSRSAAVGPRVPSPPRVAAAATRSGSGPSATAVSAPNVVSRLTPVDVEPPRGTRLPPLESAAAYDMPVAAFPNAAPPASLSTEATRESESALSSGPVSADSKVDDVPTNRTEVAPLNRRRDPRLLSKVLPRYPAELLSAGVSGEVRVGITVDARGQVSKIRTFTGHELLRREAAAAVQRWRYEPASVDGVPTDAEMTVLFTFSPHVRQ